VSDSIPGQRDHYIKFSLNQPLRRLPGQMTQQHLKLSPTAIATIPDKANDIIPR
jgi:hypothetical protein